MMALEQLRRGLTARIVQEHQCDRDGAASLAEQIMPTLLAVIETNELELDQYARSVLISIGLELIYTGVIDGPGQKISAETGTQCSRTIEAGRTETGGYGTQSTTPS